MRQLACLALVAAALAQPVLAADPAIDPGPGVVERDIPIAGLRREPTGYPRPNLRSIRLLPDPEVVANPPRAEVPASSPAATGDNPFGISLPPNMVLDSARVLTVGQSPDAARHGSLEGATSVVVVLRYSARPAQVP